MYIYEEIITHLQKATESTTLLKLYARKVIQLLSVKCAFSRNNFLTMSGRIFPGRTKTFIFHYQAGNLADYVRVFYNQKEFIDVDLIADIDDTRVRAHRFVLSAASDYFLGMFRCPSKEDTLKEIILKDIDGITLKTLVDFMYSGKIDIRKDTAVSLTLAADFLKMPHVVKACRKYMADKMDPSNCLSFAFLAEKQNYMELYKDAMTYACTHIENVYAEEEYLNLSKEQVTKFLVYSNVVKVRQEKVFLSIIAWLEYDKANRKRSLFQLLSLINYPDLDPGFIVQNSRSIHRTGIKCIKLINSWLQWHFAPVTHKLYYLNLDIFGQVEVHAYSPQLKKWLFEKWPYVNRKDRRHFGAAMAQNKLIIAGGSYKGSMTNSVECLDLQTMKWHMYPRMGKLRIKPAVAVLGGNVYVLGGIGIRHELRSVEKYDCSLGRWIKKAPLRMQILNIQAVALKGFLYVFGDNISALERYDPLTNHWCRTAFKLAHTSQCVLAAVRDYVYAVGGIDSAAKLSKVVERYDPSTNAWAIVATLREAYNVISCCALNNRLIICGKKTDDNEHLNTIEEYNPDTGELNLLPMFSSNYPRNTCTQLFSL